MSLSSTHIRLTRTSSDLRMLLAAPLPPPILKADDLLVFSSSEEIPVLLGAATHVCDARPPAFSEPPGLWSVAKEPDPTDNKLDTAPSNTRDVTCNVLENYQCGEPGDACVAPGGLLEALSNSSPARTTSSELKNAVHLTYDDTLGGGAGRSSMPGDYWALISVEQGKFDEGLRDSQGSSPRSMKSRITSVAPREDMNGDQLLTNQISATFHTYTTLPTPIFAPPSPSSSTDVISPLSSPVGRRHRRPLERARAVRFPGRPKSPRLQSNEVEFSLMRDAPPSPTNHTPYPRRQLIDSTDPCTADARVPDDAPRPFVKHVGLPEEFSWMKYMAIELWIDQEGFRAVKSCMQLMGYSPRTRSLHPYESAENGEFGVTGGVAEFMPTKRETFAFHYATLDGPPTLRMISTADDESHDHISRQATLSVKTNGVYTVLGTETLIPPILNSDSHGSKVCWKFDYLVSDRKVDGTGKVIPGEKTLTPLTFSCSPYLFHPMQGRKTGLMHIMKKNLAPKLGSQKVEPPSSHRMLPVALRYLSTRDAASHIRSRSDASSKGIHYRSYPLARSLLDAGVGGRTIPGADHIPRSRRRRASSAGENSLSCPRKVESKQGGIGEGMLIPLFR